MASLFNHFDGDGETAKAVDFDFIASTDSESQSDEFQYDVSDEDIRKMLEAIAPQMSELEDVLKDISATDNSDDLMNTSKSRSLHDLDDEDLDDEINHLALSEQALREELEFAQDINLLLLSPSREQEEVDNDEDNNTQDENRGSSVPISENPVMFTPTKSSRPTRKAPDAYTLQDHAQHLKLRTEKFGGWYYCDMTRFLLHDQTTDVSSTTGDGPVECLDLVKDYALPIPFRKLKRLYSGIAYHHIQSIRVKKDLSSPARMFASPTPKASGSSSATTFSTATPQKVHPVTSSSTSITPSASGMLDLPPPPPPPPPQPPVHQEEPLPVRTIAIRIRPDVLVGAVMDSVHHAFEGLPQSCVSHIMKRQGGHFRAAVYVTDKSLAYVADVQLCTQKNDDLERRLLIRFYHVQDDPEAMQELGQIMHHHKKMNSGSQQRSQQQQSRRSSTGHEDEQIQSANLHMRQACSLIQRLMAAQQQGGVGKMDANHQMSWLGIKGNNTFPSEELLKQAVGIHLEANFKPCPSVREENKRATPTIRKLTLPSLSGKDSPLMDISWELTTCVMDELDTRDCSYNTLMTLPFGRFPALNSIDTHYCSQLRRLSRESMINSLLRSAKDLEDYAKGAEYSCAVCIALLQPVITRYDMKPLDLPRACKSLQEYPLNFTPPQVAFPPWGQLVLEADNHIQSKTPTGEIDSRTAVQMIYNAFTKQDDEEQAARLGRKNAQIMDRLATLQSHQRLLVQRLSDAHRVSEKAAREAGLFLKYARDAVNEGKAGHPRLIRTEVPLLTLKISHGASSSGTCYISASQILFVSTYIPFVGSRRSTLFDLDKVSFQVDESVPPSILNPFPNTMNVILPHDNEVLLSFRPTVSPTRLLKLLTVIQSFRNEGQPSEFSQGDDPIGDDVVNVTVEQVGGIHLLTEDCDEDQLLA